jgi:hypothetical protein
MAKFSLVGATVSVGGTSGCVESGNIDFGELNMVDTTCSTDETKTYVPGTFEGASGSITINDDTLLSAFETAYNKAVGDDPETTAITFVWADTAGTSVEVTGFITNLSYTAGVDQSISVTATFTGTGDITFNAP